MIYIIDDDEDLVTVTCKTLAHHHYPTQGFTAAKPALEALKKYKPALKKLILIDFSMPGTKHQKLFWQELVERFSPLLLMSGYHQDHPDLKKVPRQAFAGFLAKPLSLPSLLKWAETYEIPKTVKPQRKPKKSKKATKSRP